jgi:hypothetical protein
MHGIHAIHGNNNSGIHAPPMRPKLGVPPSFLSLDSTLCAFLKLDHFTTKTPLNAPAGVSWVVK